MKEKENNINKVLSESLYRKKKILNWESMLFISKVGHGVDVFKCSCPVMPIAIRNYFSKPRKWLPGCKTHSDNARKEGEKQ